MDVGHVNFSYACLNFVLTKRVCRTGHTGACPLDLCAFVSCVWLCSVQDKICLRRDHKSRVLNRSFAVSDASADSQDS